MLARLRHEYVTGTPYGLQITRSARIGFDEFAQTRNHHVHAAVVRVVLAAARQTHQLIARQRLPRPADKRGKDGEFARGQALHDAIAAQFARAQIECTSTEFHISTRARRAGGYATAAQHGAHAGNQFARTAGLRKVVIRADFQADDAIHFVALGREHHDRCFHALATQSAADRQAVFAGQHQIENDQIDVVALQLLVHLAAAAGADRIEFLLTQITHEQIAQSHVVVDNQYTR